MGHPLLRPRRAPALAAAALSVPLIAFAGCPKASPAVDQSVTVFVTADLRGYLGPCGCTEHMLGGIDRAAAQIARARRESTSVAYVEAGDSLFDQPDIPAEQVPQDQRKAQALAEAYRQMGLAGFAVGHRDLALGVPFLTSLALPLLDAGLGPPDAPRKRLVDAGGTRVGFIAAETLDQNTVNAAQAVRWSGAQVVVALLHEGAVEVAHQSDQIRGAGIDLVIPSHVAVDTDGEKSRSLGASIPVLAPMSKGRSLIRADFVIRAGATPGFFVLASDQERQTEADLIAQRIDAELAIVRDPSTSAQLKQLHGGKIAELRTRREQLLSARPAPPPGRSYVSYRFIELSDEKPFDPAVKTIVEKYDHDVGQLNLAWAKEHGRDCPKAAAGQASVAGADACDDCHDEAAAVWKKTGHSHAYQTLVEKNRQYDLDCIRCHVTGYNLPGGVCRVDRTEGRTGVRCEACHGPGSIHDDDPEDTNIVKKPSEATCRTCHTPENSPNFNVAAYMPRILGPGHGKPSEKPPKKHEK
jgi:hypothetical protein